MFPSSEPLSGASVERRGICPCGDVLGNISHQESAYPMRFADPDLQRFAAAVVHELRTPLSALTVEVELALRPERSATAARDAIVRIADLVDELFDQTRDLAALADGYDPDMVQLGTARLPAPADIATRYQPGTVSIDFPDAAVTGRLVGDELLLRRAILLLTDHAVRHRTESGVVRLRTRSAPDERTLVLLVDAVPELPSDVWRPLVAHAADPDAAQGPRLRLTAAANMIRACGGTLTCAAGATALRVELRRALP